MCYVHVCPLRLTSLTASALQRRPMIHKKRYDFSAVLHGCLRMSFGELTGVLECDRWSTRAISTWIW